MSTPDHINKLPRWAQLHIVNQALTIQSLEQQLPWVQPGMEWFTLLRPNDTPPAKNAQSRLIYTSEDGNPNPVVLCALAPGDYLFIGRAKYQERKDT